MIYTKEETHIANKNAYHDWLGNLEWRYFATLTTTWELAPNSARSMMERYFEMLKREMGSVTIFWVTEKYKLKDGCHLHALITIPQEWNAMNLDKIYQVASGAKNSNQYFKATFSPINKKRKWVDYILKDFHKSGSDFDIQSCCAKNTADRQFAR